MHDRYYVELRRPDGTIYKPSWFYALDDALAFVKAWCDLAGYRSISIRRAS